MKKIIPLLVFVLIANSLLSQRAPEGYTLKKIIQAKDLMVGAPENILFNEKLGHAIISYYDGKKSYLAVYETENWERVNQIEVSNKIYLGQSHFDCDNEELLYGDYGSSKPKYYTFNILSDYKEKTKNKDLPSDECGYVFKGSPKLREQTFRVKEKFILILNHPKKMIQVFAKKVKRT